MMYFDEKAKKIVGQQEPSDEFIENILVPISNDKEIKDSIIMMVMSAYFMGEINGKQVERARRAKMNSRVEVSKELADFMRLFYQIIEGKTDDMTVGDLYKIKDKYGLANEEARAIFSL